MEYIIKTDVGVVRSENQDRAAVFQNEKYTLAVLCDGMGGHEGGSYASSITIDTFEKEFNKQSVFKKPEQWFEQTIKQSKKAMAKFANKDTHLLDMGTTVTAVLFENEGESDINIFNIGDSRTYFYTGLLHQVTEDHNLRNYYIDKYNYSPEDAAKVMGAAALTSALGPKKRSSIDYYVVSRKTVKNIILTSDGIHDYIAKPLFERVLSSGESLEEKSLDIIKYAIKGKSSDNLTIVILDMEK